MMPFGVYRLRGEKKGEIIRNGWSEPAVIALQLQENEKADCGLASGEVRSRALDYVNENGEIIPRPEMQVAIDKTQIVADNADKATISGLPDGATITVNGVVFTPGKPSETLTSDRPATYEILVSCWPYVDVTFTLDAD